MPFEKGTLEKIMTEFHLPKALLQAIVDGELHFSTTPHTSEAGSSWKAEIATLCLLRPPEARYCNHQPKLHLTSSATGFVLRTAPDYNDRQDLALSLAFQPTTGFTTALLLGCSSLTAQGVETIQDLEIIETFLRFPESSTGHPRLLLALIFLLQLERYKQQDDHVDNELLLALHGARLNRLEGHEVRASSAANAESNADDIPYNDLTKRVLEQFTEAGFLVQAMTQFSKLLDRIVLTLATDLPLAKQTKYHEEHTIHIKEYIEATKDMILSSADNNRLAAERASLLISSIWNLIAQEGSQKSRNIAAQSQALAEQSKALAVSSKEIAEDAINVLSKRTLKYFRMYWWTATPLTVVVLVIWMVWILWSIHLQKKEDEKLEKRRARERALKIRLANGHAKRTPTMKVVRMPTTARVGNKGTNTGKPSASNVVQTRTQAVPSQGSNTQTNTQTVQAPAQQIQPPPPKHGQTHPA
ncbi:hypothetical protein K458DRAFT_386535 [Lentithecium fluviatile CBS 122367]|uniref:Uncharacterized protein n=1 Tax=Lentithecium fluviatile CBS 122367 TaxID=1168545 RepID=A0A6G1J7N9_9PLEO|nr:hypothetical protein K458DRAFT_386535 [Lentithecium fluviatile CBS 122367]